MNMTVKKQVLGKYTNAYKYAFRAGNWLPLKNG